jgi:hypothetical protein
MVIVLQIVQGSNLYTRYWKSAVQSCLSNLLDHLVGLAIQSRLALLVGGAPVTVKINMGLVLL